METISARELDQYIGNSRYLIIDLRSGAEFMRGHVEGAENAPQGRFPARLAGHKDKTLILYCERGAMSMAAARDLERRGYRTMTVVGGYRAYRGGENW